MADMTNNDLARYFGFQSTPDKAKSFFSGQMRQAGKINSSSRQKFPGFSQPVVGTELLNKIDLDALGELKKENNSGSAERARSLVLNRALKSCPRCRAAITPGLAFCAQCGAKL